MFYIEKKESNYIVEDNASLEEALAVITTNHNGAVIVVGQSGVLQGVVSDGDIRRALLRQATMVTPVSKILNMNVKYIDNGDDIEGRSIEILNEYPGINLIPVVNKKNMVVGVVLRNRN